MAKHSIYFITYPVNKQQYSIHFITYPVNK